MDKNRKTIIELLTAIDLYLNEAASDRVLNHLEKVMSRVKSGFNPHLLFKYEEELKQTKNLLIGE